MAHAHDLPEAKGHHVYDREKGYVPAEYEHQEYPKTLPDGRIVASAEEEKAATKKPAPKK